MHVWSETLVMDLAEILHIERTSWKQHEEFCKQSMLGISICLRLRWARETWARGIFRRLCDQFCVDTAVDLASALLVCLTRNDSIVHIQVKRAYYGMVHERTPHERWQEHRRAVMQHSANLTSDNEQTCAFVARHGGAASWLFLPHISCGQVIPCHRLHGLE